jgi:predicted metal-dependent hydrolase
VESVEQFWRGIEEFNEGRFFECHDTLEDLWHGTRGRDRLFLQGLIQVSVGFYHLMNANYRGACSQFSRGLLKLEGYKPAYYGLDIDGFTERVESWRSLAEEGLRGSAVDAGGRQVPKLLRTSN